MSSPGPWLQNLLRLKIPAGKEEARQRSLHRALVALRNGPQEEIRQAHPLKEWLMAGGIVTVLATVIVMILPVSAPDGPSVPSRPQPSASLLAEMEKLFPKELKAVIVEDGEVSVRLAESGEAMPEDQRVRVSLRKGSEEVDVLTYSGQKVCMKVNGTPVCLTPLLTGENTVFVLTESNLVLPAAGATLAGYHMSVEHLGGASL